MNILMLSKRIYTRKDLIADRYSRIYEFSRYLAESGHQVHGIALDYHNREDPAAVNTIDEPGLLWESRFLKPNLLSGLIHYRKTLVRIIEQFKPDLVLSVSDIYHVIAGDWAARKYGLPHVADLYDNYESFPAAKIPGIRQVYRKVLARADGIICISRALIEYIHKTSSPAISPVHISNAVDPAVFFSRNRVESRKHFSLPVDKPLIGMCGALSLSRGIDTVLTAHELVLQKHPDTHLVLAGSLDTGYKLPPEDHIIYLGELDYEEMPKYYSAVDVNIISNIDSGFGRYCFPQKFYETLACGTAAAATGIGDVAYLMRQCPQALFTPGSAEELASAIISQIDHKCIPSIAIKSWEEQSRQLLSYLETVINKDQSS